MSKKSSKPEDFIQNAYYKGGDDALKSFISAQLRYPEAALAAGVAGTVHVKFQVDHKGEVVQAQALTHLGHGLEEEALRLTRLLRYEVPQRVRHLRVTYNKTLRIHFKLPTHSPQPPAETPPAAALHIQYEWQPSDKPTPSYAYTIHLT